MEAQLSQYTQVTVSCKSVLLNTNISEFLKSSGVRIHTQPSNCEHTYQ